MPRRLPLLLALGALAVPAAAQAHVTVQPETAVAGSFTVESVRVPNEQEKASTTKVQLKLPPGFASVAYQPVPGWDVQVTKVKLAKPVQTDDGPVTEGVGQVTWTAKDKASGIAPGAFQDFPLSLLIPGKPGDTLTFKALQTYSDGQVVRWIGGPGADEPAPTVQVIAAPAAPGAGAQHPSASPATAAPSSGGGDDGGGDSKTLAVVALVVGAGGLAVGAAAFALARRRGPTVP
jgi:uncharacterized protein YcnI